MYCNIYADENRLYYIYSDPCVLTFILDFYWVRVNFKDCPIFPATTGSVSLLTVYYLMMYAWQIQKRQCHDFSSFDLQKPVISKKRKYLQGKMFFENVIPCTCFQYRTIKLKFHSNDTSLLRMFRNLILLKLKFSINIKYNRTQHFCASNIYSFVHFEKDWRYEWWERW